MHRAIGIAYLDGLQNFLWIIHTCALMTSPSIFCRHNINSIELFASFFIEILCFRFCCFVFWTIWRLTINVLNNIIQVPGSASSYSVGAQSSQSYNVPNRVTQSASLFSMSSGSSSVSGIECHFKDFVRIIHGDFYLEGISNISNGSVQSRASEVSSSSSTNAEHSHNGTSCASSGCSGAHKRNPSFSNSLHYRNRGQYSSRVSV